MIIRSPPSLGPETKLKWKTEAVGLEAKRDCQVEERETIWAREERTSRSTGEPRIA